ncbi:MAG: helix-hairpin-helix domain-containing protein [Deltaproteobacteria bacterium]|nr:helix-hairpin-helix domain-containing protein [Deltaproteobacteria bacterium]
MLVSEAQRLGAIAVLMISLTVYGVSLFHARQPIRETPLPWGNQGQGLMAVEVAGDQGRDGIYFLTEGMTVEKVLYIAGIPRMNHQGKTDFVGISTGSAVMASPQGEVNIGEMAAARKLALGLPVDLNRISEEELSLVPGIGEKMAYQIIQLRRERGGFRDLADLTALPGIKEKKLNGLKGYLIVRSEP